MTNDNVKIAAALALAFTAAGFAVQDHISQKKATAAFQAQVEETKQKNAKFFRKLKIQNNAIDYVQMRVEAGHIPATREDIAKAFDEQLKFETLAAHFNQ